MTTSNLTPPARKLLPQAFGIRLSRTTKPTQGRLFDLPPSHAPSSAARQRLPYIAGLDGLRAVAVIAVLLYHLGLDWLPGGFLGVEVFFVLSGYLITALLLGEIEQTSTISLKRFWLRRARRLLPAVGMLLAGVTVFVALAFRSELGELWSQLVAAMAYLTNWLLIFQDQSYFASFGRPEALQHLWSLAIEEQFYLLWPLVFLGGMRLLKRTWFAVAIGVAALASAAWMWLLYEPLHDPSRSYYGTDTRATGLLLGALLAMLWRPWRLAERPHPVSEQTIQRLKLAANIVGPVALAGVVWWCLALTQYDGFLFRGGFLALAGTTAALIAVITVPGTWFSQVMDNPALRWVGVRSYAIYLWHWPVFVFTRPGFDTRLDGWELHAFRLAATAVLADLSYRLVEQPIRTGQLRRQFQSWLAVLRQGWRSYVQPLWAASAVLMVVAVIMVPQVTHTTPELEEDYFILELPEPVTTPSVIGLPSAAGTAGTTGSAAATTAPPSAAPTTTPDTVAPPSTTPATTPDADPDSATTTTSAANPAPNIEQGIAYDTIFLATLPNSLSQVADFAPEPHDWNGLTPQITAFGDSIMLGAKAYLDRHFGSQITVDAQVSRQFWQLPKTIREYRADPLNPPLGEVVLIHLGSNGYLNSKVFNRTMEELADVPRVLFVNVRVARDWEAEINRQLAAGVKRWDNAFLVDWHGYSAGHEQTWLNTRDGVHMVAEGAKAYTRLIQASL